MIQNKKTYLMPDGTSRSKVGKMGGCLVHIENKVRALKLQLMGKDTMENWADTVIHKLKRLSIASDKTVQEIYEAVRGIVSDAHSVNKGLAAEIFCQLGLRWTPGKLYCCIHTVLGFQEGMTKIWLRYHKKIGYDKMYPSITGFELDKEDKSLIKQILECFLRLTADGWRREVGAYFLLTASLLMTWANSTLGKNSMETDSVTLRSVVRLAFTPLKCGRTSSMVDVKHEMISPYF